jgi:hypothetical protein
MTKILLTVGAVVLAGIVATVAGAADHKSKPAMPAKATAVAAAKHDAKGPAHKRHHVVKKTPSVHKAAHHHAK